MLLNIEHADGVGQAKTKLIHVGLSIKLQKSRNCMQQKNFMVSCYVVLLTPLWNVLSPSEICGYSDPKFLLKMLTNIATDKHCPFFKSFIQELRQVKHIVNLMWNNFLLFITMAFNLWDMQIWQCNMINLIIWLTTYLTHYSCWSCSNDNARHAYIWHLIVIKYFFRKKFHVK